MPQVIELRGVSKIYNPGKIEVKALNNVDLSIGQGEFTAIVGPSGSGKSTLLNIIGGLDQTTEGEVQIGGQDISSLSDKQLIDFRLNHIGFVFQAYNLIPVLTAAENVEFIMLLQNKNRKLRNQRTRSLLEAVGLKAEMNRRPGELSGGQQQRVAVARALASHPQFILADEPTANLDSASAENLLDMMVEINEKKGTTFVFSTHDERVVKRARRVIRLDDGLISRDTAA